MGRKDRRIAFYTNPTFTHGRVGWSPDDDILGGTEESVVEWAKRLKERGYDVTVYTNGKHGVWHGVPYKPHDDYTTPDICISVNATMQPDCKTWYLTNQFDIGERALGDYYGVILPSKWAFDTLGVRHENVKILPHGYDAETIFPDKKIRNQCLYASSPDRGLDTLLMVWPEVVERVPSASLIVTYGGSGPQMKNVFYTGQVSSSVMDRLFRTSDFWVHPCNGGEMFCMSGIKAQVALAIPIFFPVYALRETVRHGVRANEKTLSKLMVRIMESERYRDNFRRVLKDEHYADWEDSTDILETILES